MKMPQHLRPAAVRVQLHIVANRTGRKQPVDPARRNQLLRDDAIQKLIALFEKLPRLCAVIFVVKNARIDALQSPGMEERRPVNELAQLFQWEIIEHPDTRE